MVAIFSRSSCSMYYQPSHDVVLTPKAAKTASVTPENHFKESPVPVDRDSTGVESSTSNVTNYAWNLFYVAVFLSLQANGVFMLAQSSIVNVVSGIVTFLVGTLMQLLEIIQPPQVMKWVPFWETTIGRGLVICFVSTLALHGVLIMGLVTWILSIAIVCIPLVTGTFFTPPPFIEYRGVCPTTVQHGVETFNSPPTDYESIETKPWNHNQMK